MVQTTANPYSVPSPCKNSGTCRMVKSLFILHIHCHHHHLHHCHRRLFPNEKSTQAMVQTTASPCSIPSPCKNSGTCRMLKSLIHCHHHHLHHCRRRLFLGEESTQAMVQTTANPCSVPSPCKNSGTCNVAGGTFTCTCLPGFGGTDCGIVSVAVVNGPTVFVVHVVFVVCSSCSVCGV